MKMYVVVRDDLSVAQKAVQAGHALAEYLKENKDTLWNNGTLVYLTTKNIEQFKNKLDVYRIEYNEFREPDIGNELTAIASTEGKRFFKKLKLL